MRPEGFWDTQLGYEDGASFLNVVQFEHLSLRNTVQVKGALGYAIGSTSLSREIWTTEFTSMFMVKLLLH